MRPSKTLVAAAAILLPIAATAESPAEFRDVGAVRLIVSPEGFGDASSSLLLNVSSERTRDEDFATRVGESLVSAGVRLDPDADVTLRTWWYGGRGPNEAVVRLTTGDSEVEWSALIVDHHVTRSPSEEYAEAIAESVAWATGRRDEKPRGVEILDPDTMVRDLSRKDEGRRSDAVRRLVLLQDPGGIDALLAWSERVRREGDGHDDPAAFAPPRVFLRRWLWNRSRAELRRGEFESAIERLRRLADLDPGHLDARFVLGDLMLRGQGVEQDVSFALDELRAIARRGHADAAYLVGYVHAAGELVPRDTVAAAIGFETARRLGHPDAAAALEVVLGALTPEQRGEVDRRTDAFELPEPPRGPIELPEGATYQPTLIEASRVLPEYPEAARQARLSGRVILEAVIGKDGTVDDIRVLRVDKPGLGFEQAAIDAVRQWRFVPPRRYGVPVEIDYTISLAFTLSTR